jgi:hypothetical protein
MPFSMVHFSISVRISELVGKPLSPEFLLGCISPDCIYMSKDKENEAKDFTHLNLLSLKNEITDELVLERMKSFLQTYSVRKDKKRTEFLIGYISHILADLHWIETVSREFKEGIPAKITKKEQWEIYQNEQNQIDFDIYKTAEWKELIWNLLSKSTPIELENLIKQKDVTSWRDFLLEYFETDAEPKTIPTYITSERVINFIESATKYILKVLEELKINLGN